MIKTEQPLDGFMLDLKVLIASLIDQHNFFDIHLVGENGTVRVKVNYVDSSYELRRRKADNTLSK